MTHPGQGRWRKTILPVLAGIVVAAAVLAVVRRVGGIADRRQGLEGRKAITSDGAEGAAASLDEPGTITWVSDDLPPAFIHAGPDRGKGIVDGVVAMYVERLPEYEHRFVHANMPRILGMMKAGGNVCYAGLFKTPEREQFIQFSIPNLITMSNGVVVARGRARSLVGQGQEVSLEELLRKKDLTLGVTQGRAYGGRLDELLSGASPDSPNIVVRAGQDSLLGLLRMLGAGRIDYCLGFPWEVPYVAKHGGLAEFFDIVPISETKDARWVKNYIGCPRNEWGIELIRKIDGVLRTVMPTEAHMQHQLKWFPAAMAPLVRQAYAGHILTVNE